MPISDDVLKQLGASKQCVTLDELDGALGEHARRAIIMALGKLKSHGFAKNERIGCYLVTDRGRQFIENGNAIKSGPNGPLKGQRRRISKTLTARLWKALRSERKGTTKDLVSLARTEKDGNPDAAATKCMNIWFRSGFITKLKKRRPGTSPTSNGFVVWYLIRDNGPNPPFLKHGTKHVHDGNNDEVWTLEGIAVEVKS